MPTITIRNGLTKVTLTKREWKVLEDAREICQDLANNYPAAKEDAGGAFDYLLSTEGILRAQEAKPAKTVAELA